MAKGPIAYDLADYTDQGVLKVSPGLWLAILFLCRQPAFVLIAGVTSLVARRRGFDPGGFGTFEADPLLMLTSLPALVVLGAAARRVAGAGRTVRLVWRRGRWLLIFAALLDLLLHFLQMPVRMVEIPLVHLAGPLIDLYLIVYLTRSRRVLDTFAEFPPAGPD